jgi:hypothetical protein
MSLAAGVIGTGVIAAERTRLLREVTSGEHLATAARTFPARLALHAGNRGPR